MSASAMAAGQPQFRYSQPPSKVLHVRNLPWEATEEELSELCKPFGRVVNTKTSVGANRNQAFVEFADLNQAIAMVSYYASSSEPAQVRGKAVYLQYSTRQEITTSNKTGDSTSGNVLLVTIEGVEAGDVTIDVLHLVFSAFGFVQKIATFEKSAGFQALVQYGDPETANSAKTSLDGRSIPSYLLPEHVQACSLRISFSAHTDLNVKFQSHRSRDYTNPYLPVSSSATDAGVQLTPGPVAAVKGEAGSNVLLASIENMQYPVTMDVLHTVFSAYGAVQKIAIFEKSAGFQALVQFPDIAAATSAKDALEGHCIYEGGYCKLRISFSRHTDLNVKANNDRSRDFTRPDLPTVAPIPAPSTTATTTAGILSSATTTTAAVTPFTTPSAPILSSSPYNPPAPLAPSTAPPVLPTPGAPAPYYSASSPAAPPSSAPPILGHQNRPAAFPATPPRGPPPHAPPPHGPPFHGPPPPHAGPPHGPPPHTPPPYNRGPPPGPPPHGTPPRNFPPSPYGPPGPPQGSPQGPPFRGPPPPGPYPPGPPGGPPPGPGGPGPAGSPYGPPRPGGPPPGQFYPPRGGPPPYGPPRGPPPPMSGRGPPPPMMGGAPSPRWTSPWPSPPWAPPPRSHSPQVQVPLPLVWGEVPLPLECPHLHTWGEGDLPLVPQACLPLLAWQGGLPLLGTQGFRLPQALTSKVVYADENSGHVHLCLPFYVDVCGECHLSLYRGCCCSGARTLHNHPAEIEERRELMGKVLAELMSRAQKRRKMKAREAIAKVQAAKEARMQHVDKDALMRALSKVDEYPPTKAHAVHPHAPKEVVARCWSPAMECRAQRMRVQQPRAVH
ncbi:unnamed protein product [Closterium sp. Naga37s-1]|nr:unnamed protein product [Closterium sp. Naga37s-1]